MISRYIEEANFEETGFSYTLSLISGKYKMIILYCLMEYKSELPVKGITQNKR
jgi:DNA-binding HxlR family transcriptional regulator